MLADFIVSLAWVALGILIMTIIVMIVVVAAFLTKLLIDAMMEEIKGGNSEQNDCDFP